MEQRQPHQLPFDALLNTAAWRLPGQPQHPRGILSSLYTPLIQGFMGCLYGLLASSAYFALLTIILILISSVTGASPGTFQPPTTSLWAAIGVLAGLSSPIWLLRRLAERSTYPGRHAGRRLLVELLARLAPLAAPDEAVIFDNRSPSDDKSDVARWHMTLSTTQGPQPALICAAETQRDLIKFEAHWRHQGHAPLLTATWRRQQGRWSDADGRDVDDPALQIAHDLAMALKLDQLNATPDTSQTIQLLHNPPFTPTSTPPTPSALKVPALRHELRMRQPAWRPPAPSIGDVIYSLATATSVTLGLVAIVDLCAAHGWTLFTVPVLGYELMILVAIPTCILSIALQQRFPDGMQSLPLRATRLATQPPQECIEFDGRFLSDDLQRIDLDEPFTLNLTQLSNKTSESGPSATWMTVELVQRLEDQPARRLRFQCPSASDKRLPTLDAHATRISADACHRDLWPLLLTKLDAHGQKPRFDLRLTTQST